MKGGRIRRPSLRGATKRGPQMARRLAFWTAVAMGLVLAAGVLVTKTESGRGCGDDFPLCRGGLLPEPTVESWIEYSHRAVSGIAFVLVAATVLAVRRAFAGRRTVVAYAWTAFGFTLLQAVLGALAVVRPQSDAVMALHFGFSLIAFAAAALLALETRRFGPSAGGKFPAQPADAVTAGGTDAAAIDATGAAASGMSRRFARLVLSATAYAYAAVYLGAYVRHTDSQGGCTGWPLCNGKWIPELSGATGIAFAHRLAALGMLALALALAAAGHREKNARIRLASRAVPVWTLAQVASGGVVSVLLGREVSYLAASVVHTLLIGGLFTTLAYLSVAAVAALGRGYGGRRRLREGGKTVPDPAGPTVVE